MTARSVHNAVDDNPCSDDPPPATVLIADDSPVDRRLSEELLAKSLGWRWVSVADGTAALVALRSGPIDVVLTDLVMPDMNGMELVEHVRDEFPLVPVVLMTAHGSEEIAIQALRGGAASYVPKRSMAHYLASTLDQIVTAARASRCQQRLLECLSRVELSFQLDNDPSLVPALISRLQDAIARMAVCDQNTQMRVGIAIEEAVLNGLYHGNLELDSDLKQDGTDAYYRLGEERRVRSPYRERRLYLEAQVSRDEAVFVVRDDGPGFDFTKLPDPTDPANVGKTSGRGLLLIRTFMDEVRHNPRGNEITLVKRKPRAKAAAG